MKKIFATLLGLSVLAYAGIVSAAGKDELWEVSSKMEMAGMPMAMPVQTQNVCLRKGMETDPKSASKNDECSYSDLKRSGNKTTFNMKCTGKEPMTGSAEMINSKDAYNIKMKMHSNDGDMNMVTNGKRIGNCDFDKDGTPAKMAQIEAQTNKSVAEGAAMQKKMQQENCAKQRKEASTYEGYNRHVQFKSDKNYQAAVKEQQAQCPIDYSANLKTLCQSAEADNQMDFAIDFCPAQAKAMKAKYCTGGRSYTQYSRLCTGKKAAFEDEGSPASSGDKSATTAAEKPSNAVEKPAKAILDGAKNLKGMFGF